MSAVVLPIARPCVCVRAEGDAVLGYVRWRMVVNPTTNRCVAGVVDMLCVLQTYRNSSIAKRLLGYCIQARAVASLLRLQLA